jgi:hypothetical protein
VALGLARCASATTSLATAKEKELAVKM